MIRKLIIPPMGAKKASSGRRRCDAIVVDDDGQVWSVADPALHLRLGARPDASFNLTDYLVEALGWVAFSSLGDHLRVQFNPSIAAPAAISTMRTVLASRADVPVLLATDGSLKPIGSGAEAGRFIADLSTRPMASLVGPRFHSERQPLQRLYRERRSNLLALLTRGRSISHRQIHDSESALAIARSDTLGRTNVNRARPGLRGAYRWTTEYLAPSISFFDDDDRSRIVANEMLRSPDTAFASFCMDVYERTMPSGEPSLDFVQARIHRRVGPPVDTWYLRLLQPFRAKDGGWLMLSSTEQMTVGVQA